jgi:hypothetical protein
MLQPREVYGPNTYYTFWNLMFFYQFCSPNIMYHISIKNKICYQPGTLFNAVQHLAYAILFLLLLFNYMEFLSSNLSVL